MILSQRNLDYKKYCQIEFGAYVQAVQDNGIDKNTNRPRTIDAIYLRPERNLQGGHELMDLQTGRVIIRSRVTEIPVTDLVIKTVEMMAEDQGIGSLKFYNKKGKYKFSGC